MFIIKFKVKILTSKFSFRKAICPICPDVSMDGLDRLIFIKSVDTFAESILVLWILLQLLELNASVY